MKNYIIKRILISIPLLICISFLCFVFINLIPSDPAEVALKSTNSNNYRRSNCSSKRRIRIK